jgi:lysophospholipase L1-like esterase
MKLHTTNLFLILSLLALASLKEEGQLFDLSKEIVYSKETGFGYDFNTNPQSENNRKPAYFSIKVEDGNYKVTFEIGSDAYEGDTTIRAEGRRLLLHNIVTQKGETKLFTFTVHKRSPKISDGSQVRLKQREVNYLNWDEKLTFEFNGNAPAVKSLKVEKDNKAITLFLCGDSTVVDQEGEPWASWGQMIPRWFNENICIANYAESGETTTSFMAEKRLDKALSMAKEGDYIFVEFGHNDEKDSGANAGAFKNYAENLRTYINKAKVKGAKAIILSPTARRWFDGGKVTNTHGDYPKAARQVAEEMGVPFIDITQMTTDMLEAYGDNDSKRFYVHYPAGTYSSAALKDETHFNPFGAYEIAKCVVMGLKQIGSPIVNYLLDDWKDFDPKKPDDWQDFKWVPAPSIDSLKPDGS